jgi:nitroimidazol reductase NimA-like FMN-containing flavoprotein (pyridoxamine 5'-phosphate oxidase superfamily)
MLDSAGLEVLSREECLRLLISVTIGRLVFTDRALPAVQPVPFAVDRDSVVLRVPQGSAVLAAHDAVVAFEADDVAGDLRRGWTVTVVGRAWVLSDPDEIARAKELPLPSRGWGPEDRYLSIDTGVMNGRRIPHPRVPSEP